MRAGYSCTSGVRYTLAGLISCGGRYSSGIMLITPSVVDRLAATKRPRTAASLLQPPSEARCDASRLLGLFLSLGYRGHVPPVLRDQVLQGIPDADEPLLPVAPRVRVHRIPIVGVFVYEQRRAGAAEVRLERAFHPEDGSLGGAGAHEGLMVEAEHVVQRRHVDGLRLKAERLKLFQSLQGVVDRDGEPVRRALLARVIELYLQSVTPPWQQLESGPPPHAAHRRTGTSRCLCTPWGP